MTQKKTSGLAPHHALAQKQPTELEDPTFTPADARFAALRDLTSARIGLGRAGNSLPTHALLDFQFAHAQARDAVHTPLDVDALVTALNEKKIAHLVVKSAAHDRDTYLKRPDLGRRLAPASKDALQNAGPGSHSPAPRDDVGHDASETASPRSSPASDPASRALNASSSASSSSASLSSPGSVASASLSCPGSASSSAWSSASPASAHSSTLREKADLCIVIADGLSALAVHHHAVEVTTRILSMCETASWSCTPVIVVEQGRVAIADEIGSALGARMTAILIGERPGLSSPDSLGIYFTYGPRPGLTDASRNCLSNIRPEGQNYTLAVHRLRYLMEQATQRQLSGVALKDEADIPTVTGTAGNFLL